MRTVSESSSRTFALGYKRDGWQISLVGVLPEKQGLGVGRALAEFIMDKVGFSLC